MLKLQRLCKYFIAVLGAAAFLFLTIYAWRYTKNIYAGELLTDTRDSILWNLAAVLLVLFLTALLGQIVAKWTARAVHRLAVGVALGITLLLLGVIYSVVSYNSADQVYLFDGASRLAEGTFDITMWRQYFRVYPFQLGLVKVFSVFFRLAGENSNQVVQAVNAVCVGISLYTGFRITRELFDDRMAEVLYLLIAVAFLPLEIYAMYFYGEMLGTCGALLSIWCFLAYNREREQKLRIRLGFGLLGILAFSLAMVARNAMAVVWIAMLIVQGMLFLKNRKWLPVLLTLAMLLAAEGTSALLVHSIEKEYDLELDQGMPVILWITMGMQENPLPGKAPGSYNDYNWDTYERCGFQRTTAVLLAREDMQARLKEWQKEPGAAVSFWKEKLLCQWIEPTYNAYVMTDQYEELPRWLNSFYHGKLYSCGVGFLNRFQSVAYFLLFGYFVLLIGRDRDTRWYLIGLLLIGELLFSLLWEAKGRYVFPYMVMALPCVAGSLLYYSEKTRQLITAVRQNAVGRKKEEENEG